MTTAATISERNTPSHQRLSVLTTHHPLCGTATGREQQALSHGESGAKSGSYLGEAEYRWPSRVSLGAQGERTRSRCAGPNNDTCLLIHPPPYVRAGAGGGELSPPRSLLMARPVSRPMIGLKWEARPRGSCMWCGSVGTSVPSTPCTGSPSSHWTARFGVARPSAKGSTRSLTSCGRPVSRFRRSNGRGSLSRSAGFTPSRVSR